LENGVIFLSCNDPRYFLIGLSELYEIEGRENTVWRMLLSFENMSNMRKRKGRQFYSVLCKSVVARFTMRPDMYVKLFLTSSRRGGIRAQSIEERCIVRHEAYVDRGIDLSIPGLRGSFLRRGSRMIGEV
jgi:hypothetical protein